MKAKLGVERSPTGLYEPAARVEEGPMDGWGAIVTLPGGGWEYTAHTEIRRLCLTAWLPQRRARIWRKGAREPLLRATPLIPHRLLMPMSQPRDRALNYARGVAGPKYLVENADGRPWTAGNDAIKEPSCFEREGAFDDPLTAFVATRQITPQGAAFCAAR
jgi:hypothetical protein